MIRTRKNETIRTTSDIEEMRGYYLAKDLYREWKEEYKDLDTGEVSPVTSRELIYGRGTQLDPESLSRISFYLQSGDIKEVEISDQQRMATPVDPYTERIYQVSATIDEKGFSFLLQAKTVFMAAEIAADFIELSYTNEYEITAVKDFGKPAVIINDRLRPVSAKAGKTGSGEEDREDTRFYKIEANVSFFGVNDVEEDRQAFLFIVKTKDLDTAKVAIKAWVKRLADRNTTYLLGERDTAVSIVSAVPFNCSGIVPREFCLEYILAEKKNK